MLADIFTYYEHRGPIAGKTVAWVGDANNMLYTWIEAAQILGFAALSTPPGYALDMKLVSPDSAPFYEVFDDPNEACRAPTSSPPTCGRAWASGRERGPQQAFADWCVDEEMMGHANPEALFMHCLPAHRGESDGRRDRRPAERRVG